MTHLLVLVLNKPELIPQVTKAFRKVGVKGATVIDSVGMGRAKAEPQLVPLIAGSKKKTYCAGWFWRLTAWSISTKPVAVSCLPCQSI